MLVFFWDPMSPQPHDSDVRALVRIAVVWNIPIACNRTSADYLITSPLLGQARASHAPLANVLPQPRARGPSPVPPIDIPNGFSGLPRLECVYPVSRYGQRYTGYTGFQFRRPGSSPRAPQTAPSPGAAACRTCRPSAA